MNTSFVFLLLLPTTITLALSQESPPGVRDIDGNLLQTRTEYYILPVVRGSGGGLNLAPTRGDICPLDVVQEDLEALNGLPLTFTHLDPNECLIRESTDLNIIFQAPSLVCVQSNVWRLMPLPGEWVVSASGVAGNTSPVAIGCWFKIEKFEDDYKIVHCPTVCDRCRPVCGDIGVKIDVYGSRRLAISDVPFKVKFKKVL